MVPKHLINYDISMTAVLHDGYNLEKIPEEFRTSEMVETAYRKSNRCISLKWYLKHRNTKSS
jgi:hypothetical protein